MYINLALYVCVYVCVKRSVLSGANCHYLSLRKIKNLTHTQNCILRQIGVCVSGIDFPATVNCSAIREVVLQLSHTHTHTH